MRCDMPGTSLRKSLNRFGPSSRYDTSSNRQRPPSKRIDSSTEHPVALFFIALSCPGIFFVPISQTSAFFSFGYC
jgi:hypothetical protein